jgi:LuxR family maltose regulon positive regulatory protein
LKEAFETAQKGGNHFIAAWALALLGSISFWRGKLPEAIELDREAVRLAGQSQAAEVSHIALAEVLYELNDLEAAASHLEKSLESVPLLGAKAYHEVGYGCLMRLRLARGDNAGAREALEMIDQQFVKDSSAIGQAVRAGRHLQLALAQNDREEAAEWGRRFEEYAYAAPFYLRQYLVRLQVLQGERIELREAVQVSTGNSQDEWQSPEWQTMWVTLRLIRALSEPESDQSLTYLTEALTLGRHLGLVRTFVDEGQSMAHLLRKTIPRGIEPEYTSRLLTIIEAEERQRKARKGEKIISSSISTFLSEREIEVLRLIEAGLSDRQIAGKLFINLSTTKTHVRHILEKLNAENRTRAVARAREFKLI